MSDRTVTIPGYAYGQSGAPRSPVSAEDLDRLKATLLWTDDDDQALRMAGNVLEDQVSDVLDVWYNFVGSHDHLVAYFAPPGHDPDQNYLDRVRARFEQWVLDTCRRSYDQTWLDYQHEIALRHTSAKKNQTDNVDARDQIPLRYIIAFIVPITSTMRSFLAKKGHGESDVERMHQAWTKAVTLQVTLWSQPYVQEGAW